MKKQIFILGINGFIGCHLTATLLQQTDFEITGIDLQTDKLGESLKNPRLTFKKGDILKDTQWVEQQIQKSDIVLPLVAIANPKMYVDAPLKIFELDFEANLHIVRLCVKYQKRIIFPSTSEVYGMCDEKEFDEERSKLILGPINKERWIYSCSKQLMDRVIYAYGKHEGLAYTLFRPFNWIGPKLDDVMNPNKGSSRVVSQFLSNIIHGRDIELVDGGEQRRCFTDVDDSMEALLKIIVNKNGCANSRIFNIGNPANDLSIKELAHLILTTAKKYPKFSANANKTQIKEISAKEYYGEGYQDVTARIPAIGNAKHYLDWESKTDTATSIKKILDFYSHG